MRGQERGEEEGNGRGGRMAEEEGGSIEGREGRGGTWQYLG